MEVNRPTEKQHTLGRHLIMLALDQVHDAAESAQYSMSFDFDPEPLCESIRKIGLVNPPCIAKDHKGQIDIIAGHRRILALKKLGWAQVECEDMTSSLPSALERLLFAFYDNLASRSFNTIEKAMALRKFVPLLKKKEVLNTIMPHLAIPSREETLNFYIQLTELPNDMKEALVRDRLSPRAVKALLTLEPESRTCLFRWIWNLSLNFNQQLQFIDMIIDLSIVHNKPCACIMEMAPLRNILRNVGSNSNNPQKAKKVLDEIRFLRYPKWREAERRFKDTIRTLSMPEGIRVDHPPFFEAPGYRMEVEFRDGKELMEKLQRLSLFSALREFQDPFSYDDEEDRP